MTDDHKSQQRHGFPVMALSGAGHMAVTLATQGLVIGMGGYGEFVQALANVKGARSAITC